MFHCYAKLPKRVWRLNIGNCQENSSGWSMIGPMLRIRWEYRGASVSWKAVPVFISPPSSWNKTNRYEQLHSLTVYTSQIYTTSWISGSSNTHHDVLLNQQKTWRLPAKQLGRSGSPGDPSRGLLQRVSGHKRNRPHTHYSCCFFLKKYLLLNPKLEERILWNDRCRTPFWLDVIYI